MAHKIDQAHKDYWLTQPTLHSGQFDSMVAEDDMTRVWVSRCEQGKDGKALVTIEHIVNGTWTTCSQR